MKLRAESDSGLLNKTLKWFLDRLSQNMQQFFYPSVERVPAWQIYYILPLGLSFTALTNESFEAEILNFV
jgi:hypothetical protein